MSSILSALHRTISAQKNAGSLNLIVFESVDSTNQVAKQIAREFTDEGLKPPPSLVVALGQEKGRGRLGRSWNSPLRGGVYASLILPFDRRDLLQKLPLAVPVGLCSSLNNLLEGRCGLKWPNDLVVEGRKLGGVLVESQLREDNVDTAIVGFGVNHRTVEDEALEGLATSIEDLTEGKTDLHQLTAELVESVVQAVQELREGRSFVEDFRELSVHQEGDHLKVRLANRHLEGTFVGFSFEGHLKIRVDGEEISLPAAEIVDN